VDIATTIISCRQRAEVLARTLELWRMTDWGGEPEVEIDRSTLADPVARISETWQRALVRAREAGPDLCLLLEDDVEPNRFLRHNLERWRPLRLSDHRGPFFASLYYCGHTTRARHRQARFTVAVPETMWGAQALLLSRTTIRYILDRWDDQSCDHQDVRMALLAARLSPLYFHIPSLVQHRDVASTWTDGRHQADDFDPLWRVSDPSPP
jgi:hypothetical protein